MTPQRYVGFWYRVFASLVDTLLFSILMGVILVIVYGQDYAASWEYVYAEDDRGDLVDFLVSWLLPAVLTMLFWEYKLATPGKMLIAAKIVDARTGGRPTVRQWIIRYVGYFVSGLPLGLGFLWVAFDPKKQGWHDKLANTVVVFFGKPLDQHGVVEEAETITSTAPS